jgi:hypothetical protein
MQVVSAVMSKRKADGHSHFSSQEHFQEEMIQA